MTSSSLPLPYPESRWLVPRSCSYGKNWHMWKTGVPNMQGDPFPYGDPELAWFFNRDGEAAKRRGLAAWKTSASTRPIPDVTDVGSGTRSPNATATENGQPARSPP